MGCFLLRRLEGRGEFWPAGVTDDVEAHQIGSDGATGGEVEAFVERPSVMQWAEAGFQMISVVSGKICPPRNCHGRRVCKNLDDFSCNTPNQPI